MKSLRLKPKVLLQEIFHLERSGRYNEAINKLDSIWKDKSSLPEVDGLSNHEAAEVFLRCGSLIGFLGHDKQIPNSQENSRNLLGKARNRFLETYDFEKVAECEVYLALAYWRTGELVEADIWIDEALSHSVSEASFVRFQAHIVKSGNLLSNKKYEEIISILDKIKEDCLEYGDNCVKGDLFNYYGLALKNLDKKLEALECLRLAKQYHQKSKHLVYLGTVENNLAQLYKTLRNFAESHNAIDNASEIFKKIKATARYAFSLDTKALIFFDEGKCDKALETVDKSIDLLKKGENVDYLVETYCTKIKVLVNLNRIAEASLCLSDAIEIAKRQISLEKANQLAEYFACVITDVKSRVFTRVYTEKEFVDENIELVLPPEISHFEEIEGVWIKNKHLEQIGLKKGSLAIIIKQEVERGDLVAVLERDSEDVICGFYDIDFGIICLEALDRKPQLFDENEIQILGKIVGVANGLREDEKKMHVEPIKAFR